MIGADAVAKAHGNDGYTLLFNASTFTTTPDDGEVKAPYDVLKRLPAPMVAGGAGAAGGVA